MKNRKTKLIIGVLLAILGISISVSFIVISLVQNNKYADFFNPKTKKEAIILYDKLISISEEEYPKTPEEVISLYLDGYKLLYGDMILNQSVVSNVLVFQRKLLSEKILNNNTLEAQLEKIKKDLDFLTKNKFKITSIKIGEFILDKKDFNKGSFLVTKRGNDLEEYKYMYYLEKNNANQWKIYSWQNI